MKHPIREQCARWLIRGITYGIVCGFLWVLGQIFWHGVPAISWQFVTGAPSPGGEGGGIFPAIAGTGILMLGTMVIALPLGMATALYLSEYATQSRYVRLTRGAIATLAGVPSIVFGLFGLGMFVLFCGCGASILAGCLTLACMILPAIIVSSEEALREVPRSLRTGSLALGATKWQTLRGNVLPYALPGMMTGAILGAARVAGETAPILLTVAAFYEPTLPDSVFDQVMALPYHLYVLATQYAEVEEVHPTQYATAVVLLTLVLGLSLFAIFWKNHFRKKQQW